MSYHRSGAPFGSGKLRFERALVAGYAARIAAELGLPQQDERVQAIAHERALESVERIMERATSKAAALLTAFSITAAVATVTVGAVPLDFRAPVIVLILYLLVLVTLLSRSLVMTWPSRDENWIDRRRLLTYWIAFAAHRSHILMACYYGGFGAGLWSLIIGILIVTHRPSPFELEWLAKVAEPFVRMIESLWHAIPL